MAAILPYWIKKYGEKEALEKWEVYKNSLKGNTNEKLKEKYGEEYVKNLKIKKNTYSLDACIKKYGEELGKIKWEERLQKKLNSQKENFKDKKWNHGQTLEE